MAENIALPSEKNVGSSNAQVGGCALPKDSCQQSSNKDSEEEQDKLRAQAWGRYNKLFMWVGIAVMWTIFELDNTTIYNCL
jgi:hypothetical protein